MASLAELLKMWLLALFYGVLVVFRTLISCFTKGFRKVLSSKHRERPSCIDDPSLGTHGFLNLKEGIRIHYVASGPEDKPLMLFVHGFPEFWYSWRHQIREFQKDYRVVAIDQRGYSESSKPSGLDNYTVEKLMSDLAQCIQGLGYKKCILVGHDWGGIVTWAFGRKYQDMVEKLIVMNCPPIPVFKTILKTCNEQFKKSWYMYFFQLPLLPEFTLSTNDYAIFNTIPVVSKSSKSESQLQDGQENEHLEAYKYTFSQPGALTPPLNYYRAWFRAKPSFEHDLEYTMPALLIWGTKDKALDIALPNYVEKNAPKIEVQKIEDADHFVQNDAATAVNQIMRDWLKKV